MKLLIITLLLCTACGPAGKLKRAEKLIKKAEMLGAQWRTDTVYIDVRIPVPEVVMDTTFITTEGDTVYIAKERLKIKYINLPGDSVFIEGECEADTVYKQIKIPCDKTLEAKGGIPWWWLIIAVWMGVIVPLIFRGLYK